MESPRATAPPFSEIPPGPCYGDETGCDVVFLVGPEDDKWRLPAHQFLLARENSVFSAMVRYDATFPNIVPVPDVDGRAFDNLLRYLYSVPVTLQSVETALLTLQAAEKYMCPGLARVCVSYLSDHISTSNVLAILKFIRLFVHVTERNNINVPAYQNLENLAKESEAVNQTTNAGTGHLRGMSGNPQGANHLQSVEGNNMEGTTETLTSHEMGSACDELSLQCLEFIDKNAKAILESEEFEDLDISTVRLILTRDTIDIKNEMLVYTALMRWADKECKRQQYVLTPWSKRQILGDSIFLPRYLTMKFTDFQSGPGQAKVFTEEELLAFDQIFKDDIPTVDISCANTHLDAASRAEKVALLAYYHAPNSMKGFVETLARPRYPVVHPDKSAARCPAKKKRLPLRQRFLCFKRCCKLYSNPSSPANSNPSSPVRSNQGRRYSQQGHSQRSSSEPSTLDVAIQRIIICWAFFFD